MKTLTQVCVRASLMIGFLEFTRSTILSVFAPAGLLGRYMRGSSDITQVTNITDRARGCIETDQTSIAAAASRNGIANAVKPKTYVLRRFSGGSWSTRGLKHTTLSFDSRTARRAPNF